MKAVEIEGFLFCSRGRKLRKKNDTLSKTLVSEFM